jgi:hypothetical protein
MLPPIAETRLIPISWRYATPASTSVALSRVEPNEPGDPSGFFPSPRKEIASATYPVPASFCACFRQLVLSKRPPCARTMPRLAYYSVQHHKYLRESAAGSSEPEWKPCPAPTPGSRPAVTKCPADAEPPHRVDTSMNVWMSACFAPLPSNRALIQEIIALPPWAPLLCRHQLTPSSILGK